MSEIVLNEEQQAALEKIKAGGNYFIFGAAGTGKSTLLAHIGKEIPDAVFAAPTGSAAQKINGVTLNNLFHIQPIPYITEECLGVISSKTVRRAISAIKTLIVDEISMVRADIFAAIDFRLRQYGPDGCKDKPFGGRQIILSGDFFQLPPVVTNDEVCGSSVGECLERQYGGIYSFMTKIWKDAQIVPIYLRENMRQGQDRDFMECVNAFRSNDPEIREKALDVLNSRVSTELPEDAISLCPRKADVNRINDDAINELDSEERIFHAKVSGNYEKDYPIDFNLKLKLNEKIIIATNIPPDIVNGTIGKIIAFHHDGVIVRMDDGQERLINPHEYKKYAYRVTVDPATGEEHPTPFEVGCFRQLPLLPGYAITIHKAQGMTLNKAIIDRGNRGFFAHGQCYVAVSRVRRLDDLFLTQPLRLSDIAVNPRLIRWEARFRDDRMLWAECVVNLVKQLSEDEKYYVHTLPDFQHAVMEKIIGEYLRRFDEGESPAAQDIINSDLEAWCRVLFQNYTGTGNGDLTIPLDNIIKLAK